MSKKTLSESDICAKYITPAVIQAGWDDALQIRREVFFTKGRIIVRGKLVTRGKAKRADYVLYFQHLLIALIEAKDNNFAVGDGMQQAQDYAVTLDIPFVFAYNGDGFVFHDRTGLSTQIEATLALNEFPSPAKLWAQYCAWKGLAPEQEKIILQPYYDDGSGKEPRYYQRNAINATVEAISVRQNRLLLVMATGTGKTYTAFQIIWRLWKAGQKKRILFLADRNVLIDQTMVNDFRPFGAAMAKLSTGAKTIERADGSVGRLIVIDREIGSMTEFKQILGRGTRVHEDTKKYYFTLIDFRKVTNHFADAEFDGEPVQIYEPGEDDPATPPDDVPPIEGEDPIPLQPGEDETVVIDPPDITLPPGTNDPPAKYYVKGRSVAVLTERVEYLDENGKLVTESLRDYSRKAIRAQFASLVKFLARWKSTERKEAIIEELAEEGLFLEPLLEEAGKDLDPFDLICHITFDQPPLTRRDRANNVKKRDVFNKYGTQARAVLKALLAKYQDEGIVTGLDNVKILEIHPFNTMETPIQLIKEFGTRAGFEDAVLELQSALYQEVV